MILRILSLQPRHGVGVADRLAQMSRGAFALGPGSVFPALHRLEERGWVRGAWGQTDEGRRARFYELTPAGRRRLDQEKRYWAGIVAAVTQVLEPEG
jgi:transcriptional regulator